MGDEEMDKWKEREYLRNIGYLDEDYQRWKYQKQDIVKDADGSLITKDARTTIKVRWWNTKTVHSKIYIVHGRRHKGIKMKLPIKKKYFDEIKIGIKKVEYRDAHITFVCEETGEELRKDIEDCHITRGIKDRHPDVLEDADTIVFQLSDTAFPTKTEKR